MMVNGLIFRGMWQSSRQGIWWTLAEALQGNTLNKIILRKGGDLGIEPRSQYLLASVFTNCAKRALCLLYGIEIT